MISALAAGWPLLAGAVLVAWSRVRARAPTKARHAAAPRPVPAPPVEKQAPARGESIGGV
jgi:hypothetical protein